MMFGLVAVATMSVSCQEPEPPQGGGDVEEYLTLDPEETLYFGYEASEATVYVDSHDAFWDYTYDESQEWCVVSDLSEDGIRVLTVAVEENESGEDRELVVTVTNGEQAAQLKVVQSASDTTPATKIEVAEENYMLAKTMQTLAVNVTADGDYNVVIPEESEWISYDGQKDGAETFFVAENFGAEIREAVVTFQSKNTETSIVVKQWGTDDLELSVNEKMVPYIAGTDSVTVISGTTYTVSVEGGDWLTINEERSSEGQIVFDYDEYDNEEENRSATIIVKSTNSTEELVVTQLLKSETEMPSADQWKDDLLVTINNATATSQMSSSRGVLKAYDGNTKSNWFSATSNEKPVEVTFDIDASNVERIDYLRYIPATGTMTWGRWGEIDIYATDANGVESLVKTADLGQKGTNQTIVFDEPLANTTTQIRVVIKTALPYIDQNDVESPNVASAAEVGFYQYNPEAFQILDYFTDMSISELRSDVTLEQVLAIEDPFYRSIAERMFYGTYDDEFRVCEFKAYPDPRRDYELFRDKPFGLVDNVTGMYVAKANTPQYIFLDEDYGLEIYVRVVDLKTYESTKNPYGTGADDHTYDYKLQKGRNVIVPSQRGQMYMMVFTDDYEKYPTMKAHFVNSGVNGYIRYGQHTVDDVYRIFMLASKDEEPRFDMITDRAVLNFEKAQYIKGTFEGNPRNNPQGALDLLEIYDSVTKIQERIMGHDKYKALGRQRGHRNRMLFMGAYGDTFGYSSWYHTGYSAAMSSDVVRPARLWNKNTQYWNNGVVGSIWGIAHELGHSSQTDLFCWQGLAEVTNNLMCAITQNYVYGVGLGRTTMRYNDHFNKGMRDMAKRWIWDFKKDENGNGVWYERPFTHSEAVNTPSLGNIDGGVDPTTQLMPFYQLFLYYHLIEGNSDFYPDFYELCRTKAIYREDYPSHDAYQSAIALEYVRSISEAAGEDLSEWANEWGLPGINPANGRNPGMKVNHYGQAFFTSSKEQIEANNEYCSQFKKPRLNPLYIHDMNLDLYRNPQKVVAGTHTVNDNCKFTMSGWQNVAAWVLVDPNKVGEDGKMGRDVAVIACSDVNGGGTFTYVHKESRYMANADYTDYMYNSGSSYASNDSGTMRALEKATPLNDYTKGLQLYAVDVWGNRYASQSNQ